MPIEFKLLEYGKISERRNEMQMRISEVERLQDKIERMYQSANVTIGSIKTMSGIKTEFQTQLEYYYNEVRNFNKKERQMYKALKILSYEEYKIIELRYIKKYSWGQIEDRFHASRQTCINIKNSALAKLRKHFRDL